MKATYQQFGNRFKTKIIYQIICKISRLTKIYNLSIYAYKLLSKQIGPIYKLY